MADEQTMSRERWWVIAKAVAYELRPFTLPTKSDLKNAAKATRTNADQLWAEARRLAPKVVDLAKNSNPMKVFQLFLWLSGWALFIWLEFGAVYFIVSAMAVIFANLGERGDDEWSAYSVFNAGCSALLGTINAEQFEREIMRQNPAAPDVPNDHDQGDEFVWVDHPGMQRAAAAAAAAAGNADDAVNLDSDDSDGGDLNSDDGEADSGGENDGGAGGAGADAGARGGEPARGQGRKVSGKRARRGFEERRERREERRLALQALVQDEWN